MVDKRNVRYQIRILSIVITVIVFLAFFWFYQYKSTIEIHNTILQSWSNHQYKMVVELAREASSSQQEGDFDHYLKETLVPKLSYTDTSYGFIYKDGRVLFEQDSEITKQYTEKAIRDMYGAFSYHGGEHLLEVLEKIESQKSGMDYFVKRHSKGEEYVTWVAFYYAGSSYVIGIATPEVYILNEHHYVNIRNDAYVFSGIYSILIILFGSLLCVSLYQYKETEGELSNEIALKNQFIQKQEARVSDLQTKLKQFAIKDSFTEVFNRKFFDVLIKKLVDNMFLPISVCLFSIQGEENSQDNEILRQIVRACKSLCIAENSIIARYDTHEIVLLLLKTPNDVALEKAKQVVITAERDARYQFAGELRYGVATKKTELASIKKTLMEAEGNLQSIEKPALSKEKIMGSALEVKLEQFATTDRATGVYNRKFFDDLADNLVDNLFLPISVILFSVASYEGLDDGETLKPLLQSCKELCLDKKNVVARYGNREIIVLMVRTPQEAALEKTKQIVRATEQVSWGLGEISYGIATKDTEYKRIRRTIAEAEKSLRVNAQVQAEAVK
jgi:PleD family two-component response regulator